MVDDVYGTDTLVRSYEKWYGLCTSIYTQPTQLKSPTQAFQEERENSVDIASDVPSELDDVLLDNVMFSDSGLVQESLNVLMLHKSRQHLMLEVANRLQLLHPQQGARYKEMTTMLTEVKTKVEKFEIWGEMYNAKEESQGHRLLELLRALLGFVRQPSDVYTLSIRSEYMADPEMQQLLVNLNSISVLVLLQQTLMEPGKEPKPLILDILRASNELLTWMIKGNPSIQAQAFQYLQWFVERIDGNVDIYSSQVAAVILEGNSDLILNCPKKYIGDLVSRICSQGCHYCFLDMLLGMVYKSKQHDLHAVSVDREIARFFAGMRIHLSLLMFIICFWSRCGMEKPFVVVVQF